MFYISSNITISFSPNKKDQIKIVDKKYSYCVRNVQDYDFIIIWKFKCT